MTVWTLTSIVYAICFSRLPQPLSVRSASRGWREFLPLCRCFQSPTCATVPGREMRHAGASAQRPPPLRGSHRRSPIAEPTSACIPRHRRRRLGESLPRPQKRSESKRGPKGQRRASPRFRRFRQSDVQQEYVGRSRRIASTNAGSLSGYGSESWPTPRP